MDFRIPGLPHSVVKHAQSTSVRLCLHRSCEAWISVLSRMGAPRLDSGEVGRVESTSCLATNTCSCLNQKLLSRTKRRLSFNSLVKAPVQVALPRVVAPHCFARQTLAVACIQPWISNLLLRTRIRNFLFVLVRRGFQSLLKLTIFLRCQCCICYGLCFVEPVSSVHDDLCTSSGQFEPCTLGGDRTSEHCHCPSSFLHSCLRRGCGACVCPRAHMQHAGAILPSVPECQFPRLQQGVSALPLSACGAFEK